MNKRGPVPQELQLEMLRSVLEFMSGSGMTEMMIRDAFDRSLPKRSKGRNAPRVAGLRIGNENLSAELLRIWHRDGRYIDSDARPKPLSLTEGRNNLRLTILRIDPTADPTEILREMKAVKLIRKTSSGRYLPNSEAAIVSKLHPMATDHIAKLVIRLVSTVSRNVDPAEDSLPLIERHAYAPDLNWVERKAFAEFTRVQGMTYLEAVDNWLEQRRVHRVGLRGQRKKRGVSASVHLFAYLGDDGTQSSRAGQVHLSRKSKGDGKPKSLTASAKPAPPAREARA